MTVSVVTATASPALSVLGEQLRPLTPGGLAIEAYETTGPEQSGAAPAPAPMA